MLRYFAIIVLLFQSGWALNLSESENNVSQSYILYAKNYQYSDADYTKAMGEFASIKVEKLTDFNTSFPLPDKKQLAYASWGFDNHYVSLFQSNVAYKIEFGFGQKYNFAVHQKIQKYLYTLSHKAKGYLFDSATRELFTAEAWQKRRVIKGWYQNRPVMPFHITMHYYAYEKGKKRIVTLGMEKFGLPDISINDVFSAQANQLGYVINIYAYMLLAKNHKDGRVDIDLQSLADDPYIASLRSNITGDASAKTTLQWRHFSPMEGDANNRAIEILFPREKGEALYAAQSRHLAALFGSDDKVYNTEKYNKELREASQKSRKKLPELKERYNKGLLPGERISLKAPFVYSDGTEWMWVVVTQWGDKTIRGILNNTPYYIKTLKAGDFVEINEDEVFDYIYIHADGTSTGNETGKIIEKYQK